MVTTKIICPKSFAILFEEAGLAVYTNVHISDLTPWLAKYMHEDGGGGGGGVGRFQNWYGIN